MKTKAFKTHDIRGFKEMPVLISATAIQFSFGLEKYLLPNFEFIHFYPEEFVHTHSPSGFLEGNVSDRSINISWKHFLEGFQYPDDGQNVGLHEIAHAYYSQNFISTENIDNGFVTSFSNFNNTANKVFEQEKHPGNDLYSDYALRNFQEFWAESVEIFFEKPVEMESHYPQLYQTMKGLLNQDPLNNTPSMIG
jgi:Mlc titration factor MtfA (ptsG expression regulator)